MMRVSDALRRLSTLRAGLVVGLMSVVLAHSGCVESRTEDSAGFSGFSVEFVPLGTLEGMVGAKSAPLPFRNRFAVTQAGLETVKLDIFARRPEAVSATEQGLFESFTGRVKVRVVPGEIEPGKEIVQLVDGAARGVELPIRFSFGETRIWVEDIGLPEWVGGLCKTDEICTFGLTCQNGACLPGSCLFSKDCAVGHVCNGGACVLEACGTGGVCDPGFFCEANTCKVRAACTANTPCPQGFDCVNGGCIVNECSNGRDDDGNGLHDFPHDPGCDTEDRVEGGGSFNVGVSQSLFFEPPTIRSVQENPDSATGPSPLAGKAVEIQGVVGHDLVVTNIVSTGFYVSDLGDQNYNSIFVFNFSFPEGVSIGDRICEISGGVVEFNALTQLQFPSWGLQGKPRSNAERRLPNPEDEEDLLILGDIELVDCSANYGLEPKALSKTLPIPDPVMLTPTLIRNLSAMEKLEGSLVTVENVELSVRFVDCDDNGSTRIESGTAEATCRNECNRDLYCTELSSLFSFDQWRGVTGGAEVSVSSTQLVSSFDVLAGCTEGRTSDGFNRLEYTCGDRANPRTLKRVTGSLRQIVPTCDRFSPCDPADESIILFIIDPRFESDIVE